MRGAREEHPRGRPGYQKTIETPNTEPNPMLRPTRELEALERRWERETYHDMSFHEALDRFEAMWRHALELGWDPLADWRADLESDIAIARAVNGLPPS